MNPTPEIVREVEEHREKSLTHSKEGQPNICFRYAVDILEFCSYGCHDQVQVAIVSYELYESLRRRPGVSEVVAILRRDIDE
jgi:hypothetical protein